ncbi:hypothetical protein PENTCL1PPCAC_4987, partial [Pristionchus entomophagus]
RLFVVALKEIKNGEEITWHYGDSFSSGKEPIPCRCDAMENGVSVCDGFLGAGKKNRNDETTGKRKRSAQEWNEAAEMEAKKSKVSEDERRTRTSNRDARAIKRAKL